jgi:hypothetical protein
VTETVDDRLRRLQAELDGHARIARHLGLDFERPVRSLGDGYPENTVALIGKITERLLKQLWTHHGVVGDPSGKALNDLIKGCRGPGSMPGRVQISGLWGLSAEARARRETVRFQAAALFEKGVDLYERKNGCWGSACGLRLPRLRRAACPATELAAVPATHRPAMIPDVLSGFAR